MTADLLANIITAERGFARWCLRMSKPTNGLDNPEASLSEWIQWKVESAR